MSAAMLDLFTFGTVELSPCGIYRYELRRMWDTTRPLLAWIMLNPSTADDYNDDPTIRRCVGYARDWGYGGIRVRNLFALRATDPRELAEHDDPVGPENDCWLISGPEAGLTIAAWGAHGGLNDRDQQVQQMLALRGVTLHHLGDLTQDGAPRHPLYLRRDLTPQPFPAVAR